MKKRSSKSANSTWRNILLLVAIVVILIIVLDPNNRRGSAPSIPPTIITRPPETSVAGVSTAAPTLILPAVATLQPTATPLPITAAPTQTLPPLATNKPLATETSPIAVTPVAGLLYDVLRSANALRCPDTRCKVIETYKKDNIVVVIGLVNGTSYKGDKTKVWVQIISHSGTKVYLHASLVTPHPTQ